MKNQRRWLLFAAIKFMRQQMSKSVESLQWHFLQDQKQYANDAPDDDDDDDE